MLLGRGGGFIIHELSYNGLFLREREEKGKGRERFLRGG